MLKTPHHIQMMATLGVMIFLESIMLFLFTGTPRGIMTSYTTKMLPLWGEIRLNYPPVCHDDRFGRRHRLPLSLSQKRQPSEKRSGRPPITRKGPCFVGIETSTVFKIAFAMACVLEAIAGSSITAFSVVDPYTGFTLVTKAWMVVVLSGLGSIPGAIVGGLIVGVIEALSSVFISASLGTGVLFLILAVVLIFKPSGMFGRVRE